VGQLTTLRKKARESDVYLRVLKNTLVRRAVADTSFAGLADQMTGPLIYAFSADAVAAAKVLQDFAKGNDKLVLKAGCFGGKLLDKAGVQALATMPSLDELRAKIVGLIVAPATKLATITQAPAAQIARVLSAYAEKEAA